MAQRLLKYYVRQALNCNEGNSFLLTTEGGIFKATLRPSDRTIDRASDGAIEGSTERSSDRAIERPSDQAMERPSDRAIERAIE